MIQFYDIQYASFLWRMQASFIACGTRESFSLHYLQGRLIKKTWIHCFVRADFLGSLTSQFDLTSMRLNLFGLNQGEINLICGAH